MEKDKRNIKVVGELVIRLIVLSVFLFSSFFVINVKAQRITVKGPSTVAAGQPFQIQYIINTTDVKGFKLGNVPDAFEVL